MIAAFIAAECCQALDYAHRRKNPDGTSRGVVHRDVTPRNVLLSWSGEVKLTDFGIASLAGEDTSKLVGTPAYMAPEQARGEAVDVRADVYAVGILLREALTGERARAGDDRETLLTAARSGALPPWPANDIDPTLLSIGDRATSAAPEDRYATAQDMLAELDAYIVAERAKNRGDSPARLIAAWLATVWGDDREEASAGALDPADNGHLMSFLDDGSAIGTGTERSLAATAADEAESAHDSQAIAAANHDSQRAVVVEDVTPRGAVVAARAVASKDVDSRAADGKAADDKAAVSSSVIGPRRRVIVAAVVIVGAIAISISMFAMRSRHLTTNPDAAIAMASDSTREPAIADAALEPLDVAVSTDIADAIAGSASIGSAAGSASRAGSEVGSAARVGSGSSVRVGSAGARTGGGSAGLTGNGSGSSRIGSGSAVLTGSGSAVLTGSGSATPPAIALRKVRINATPWAYFTVDGGPRLQTPQLLELAPGPHRIHFENPVLSVERTITLDVPADRDISYVEPLGN